MKEYLQIAGIFLVAVGPPILFYLLVNRRTPGIEELDDAGFEKFWLLRRFIDQAPAGSVSQRRLEWLEDREKTRVFRDRNTVIWEVSSRTFMLVMRAKWDRSGQVAVEGRIIPTSLAWLSFPCWLAILIPGYWYLREGTPLGEALRASAFMLIVGLVIFGFVPVLMLPIERFQIRKVYYPAMKSMLWPGRSR